MASKNLINILNYLKDQYGQEFTKKQIADTLQLSPAAVMGSINALVRKGYVDERKESFVSEPATATRKEKVTTIVYEKLNEAGLAYDPTAEDTNK